MFLPFKNKKVTANHREVNITTLTDAAQAIKSNHPGATEDSRNYRFYYNISFRDETK